MKIGSIEKWQDNYKLSHLSRKKDTNPSIKTLNPESILESVTLNGNKITIALSGLKTEYYLKEKTAEILTHHIISNHEQAKQSFNNAFIEENITRMEKNELKMDFTREYDYINDKEFIIRKKGGLFNYFK